MALVRVNRKLMLDPSLLIRSCIFPKWRLVSTEHRPDQTSGWVLQHQEQLQLQLSVSGCLLWWHRQPLTSCSGCLYRPEKGLSCFSSLDNYFPLIPACQGQSWPSIGARDRTTSHHRSSSLFPSITLPLSVSLRLSLWLQDPLFPLSLSSVSFSHSCPMSFMRRDLCVCVCVSIGGLLLGFV